MTINLFQTPEYRAIMEEHLSKNLTYLFEKDQDFAIVCQIKHVTFTPELPSNIYESFKDTVLFVLSGYTFQSAKVEEGIFSFEAGFGNENFGSTVSMPLLAIKQLFVGDTPVVINHAEVTSKVLSKEASTQSSMNVLLSNPKNKKFLKKK
ncbi:hypothetical protein PGH07_08370 [Sulfurovum sp. zt1-1]|uniref:Stringent starvation protein B n=1 Tax=Sulfurovum zhangzhouensis TaxID=3019067 RepID=A0ABT7QZB1_9BACT|nr:hypothetical protein [Sulfurovum zhangzhouensis]MDM5272193.1 hypothetical protein [Sulfurovum zhangzhouensis]